MKVLISFRGDLLAPGLAEQFRQHSGFSAVEVARTNTRAALVVHVLGELVLCAIEPDALMVLDARRVGFERVVGATSDLPERLVAPTSRGRAFPWWAQSGCGSRVPVLRPQSALTRA